jgi:hypothetical protein
MPTKTLAWIFEQVYSHLVHLRNSNSEVFSPNQFAAPAATIQTLVNGTVCTRLLSRERWLKAYNNDVELCAVRELIFNPSMINNQALAKVNHNYPGPLRQSLISVENDMLIMKEPIGRTLSYTHLQLVPRELSNILFLNAYRTLHCLRLRFYWPGMYAFVKRMCQACPGCALANPTCSKSAELIYNFPIEAPFLGGPAQLPGIPSHESKKNRSSLTTHNTGETTARPTTPKRQTPSTPPPPPAPLSSPLSHRSREINKGISYIADAGA